ncbi:CaiB/BaiF CoA transferase family protein [Celeribacter indicus]|uniref:Putative fatty acid-CoA racemase n=1 Tax=Celeribacter indicus TaxID=1208324 RepID=A0A0B5DV20_9RHOB|nr:CaiB/BaiF CoA-transferase family protein [Celeribacter indicus]AJE45060.1 putative fatty acid-CoA racemase [Celeribacter indicus]SDX42351.1 alpha-methylacyl-CoA racemase [Celeribacter indicus]
MDKTEDHPAGPLSGLRILEFAALGPAPFGCMMLADLGASVVTIERPKATTGDGAGREAWEPEKFDILKRNRKILPLDLKSEVDRQAVLALAQEADAVVEGFRPGVMERLGLGPQDLKTVNRRLVYGRMTGWGQDGPLASSAGHDLNFLGMSGALSLFGRDGALPAAIPPLVGDMGGGGAFLAFGLLAAIFDARRTGDGQVVDAAIVDGSAALYALIKGLAQAGRHGAAVGRNMLDGGRYFYRTYVCSDGKYIAVGAIEPQFRKALLETLGLSGSALFADTDPAREDERIAEMAMIFASRPRDAWSARFSSVDACVTPVLTMQEAEEHPANIARGLFLEADGIVQPAPAPRFGKAPVRAAVAPSVTSLQEILAEWRTSP